LRSLLAQALNKKIGKDPELLRREAMKSKVSFVSPTHN
jgi:hypothetical protein